MSLFEDIYNWMARRNIGNWVGLKWDPEKDKAYQHEQLAIRMILWESILDRCDKLLAEGKRNIPRVLHNANQILAEVPDINDPRAERLRQRAKDLISRLPPETKTPNADTSQF